jgi:glutathione S-transferase
MKVYGHPWSINTRKVLVTLAEKNLEAELVLVDLPRGGQHAPEHVARHPFAKAPVLEDGDLMIYESNAIMRYLDRKGGKTQLTPQSPRDAALMDQWISIGQSYFGEAAHALLVEAIFKRVRQFGEPDTVRIAQLCSELERPLGVMERRLRTSAYLAGESFSLADITFMPHFEYADRLAVGRKLIAAHECVTDWWERVSARPSWQRVGRSGEQPPIGADLMAA